MFEAPTTNNKKVFSGLNVTVYLSFVLNRPCTVCDGMYIVKEGRVIAPLTFSLIERDRLTIKKCHVLKSIEGISKETKYTKPSYKTKLTNKIICYVLYTCFQDNQHRILSNKCHLHGNN